MTIEEQLAQERAAREKAEAEKTSHEGCAAVAEANYRRVLIELEKAEGERDATQGALTIAIEHHYAFAKDEPMANGDYPHLGICSASRKSEIGSPGCVCGKLKREARDWKAKTEAAERDLAIAGVRGSPPPGQETTIGALHRRLGAAQDDVRKLIAACDKERQNRFDACADWEKALNAEKQAREAADARYTELANAVWGDNEGKVTHEETVGMAKDQCVYFDKHGAEVLGAAEKRAAEAEAEAKEILGALQEMRDSKRARLEYEREKLQAAESRNAQLTASVERLSKYSRELLEDSIGRAERDAETLRMVDLMYRDAVARPRIFAAIRARLTPAPANAKE